MREILFKGKRIDDGAWVSGFYFFDTNGGHYIQHPFETIDGEHGYKSYEVDPETVGEFTGIKDYNGRRIFENDIVKTMYGNGVVSFSNGHFYVFVKDWGVPPVDRFMTVVGNVYDNPKILA